MARMDCKEAVGNTALNKSSALDRSPKIGRRHGGGPDSEPSLLLSYHDDVVALSPKVSASLIIDCPQYSDVR